MAQADLDELPRRRWWLKPLIALAVLAFLAAVGTYAYRRFEPARLAAKGREYFATGDYRNAVLCAQRALQINPLSEPGARLMIEITESLNSPAALDWRKQVAELNPDSTADALAWAGTALRLARPGVAQQALAGVSTSGQKDASFHEKSGLAALQGGDTAQALQHFETAVKLDPENDLHRYNLATLQIQSKDPAQRQAAADTLGKLAESGALRVYALRSLVTRLARDGQVVQAVERSRELLQEKNATFRDRLMFLELLDLAKAEAEFAKALEQTQEIAAADPGTTTNLIHWLRLHDRAEAGARWSAQLPPELLAHGNVATARVECLAKLGNWEEVKTTTTGGQWKSDEFFQHAWEARARRELADATLSETAWQQAVAQAIRRREDVQRLAALASSWGWTDEMREALWAAADLPAPQWALQTLHRSYLGSGETEGMLRVAKRTLQLDPASAPARNNLAMLSLLRGVDLAEALSSARALQEKAPQNVAYVSTYALALHLHGRSQEALTTLRTLPAAALQTPEVAAYHTLFLVANGARAEAMPHLELAQRASLLPEEKALLGAAGVEIASAQK